MKNNQKRIAPLAIGMAVLLVFTIVFDALALTKFDNIFEKFFGATPSSLKGDTFGADTNYYKSDFGSASELYAYEEKKVAQIVQEGITLLENDGLLPLPAGTELSIFSHSSVDLVSGGSGSGSGSFELTKDLKSGLENAGLVVNNSLWNFYKSGAGSSYKRGIGVVNYGADLDWSINECPLNVITKDTSLVSTFEGTVAMFVLSRTGGEGGDEARDMAAFGGVAGQHYLEPDATELEIISYLNENFDNVILLVNCNNAIELGWVADYENINAVINFPGAGRTGTYGLGYMMTGVDAGGNEISASGHLVDTWVYDNFSSPAMQNMGDFKFTGTKNDYYYVNYSEGIYVGYRYYETRYEDVVLGTPNVGTYDYASTVIYPFGYGLSYTSFEWTDFTMSAPDESGNITVTVTVKNVGQRNGMDVVQIYAQAPYTLGGVEKSSVVLVGFAKTANLAPGASETVNVLVNLKDLTSYDVSANGGKGGYVLDAGDYYITAASNAHEAINLILLEKGVDASLLINSKQDASTSPAGEGMVGRYNQATADYTTYSVAAEGLQTIENQFPNATLADAVYLSRSDWSVMENNGLRYGDASDVASRAEVGGKQFQKAVSAFIKDILESENPLNPYLGKEVKEIVFGKKGDIDLIDLRGLPYDDPLWDELLDQITLAELSKLIDECGYCSPEMKSINKPKVTDLDGPAGLNDIIAHGSMPIGEGLQAMTWPTQYMLACAWNVQLAEDMGRGIAEDGLYSGTCGWYGPGMNIHRTPFAGRNFEYYSEDAFLSGVLGKAEVNGAAQKGMYAFIKHFALNDQETHRDERGIATFADEQTIREIYLKPFEMTIVGNTVEIGYNEPIKNGNGKITGYTWKTTTVPAATAVMTSFNRIGATWAGGHYDLITDVLRGEWGFVGFVLTDYEVGAGKGSYMGTLQTLGGGGDAKLKTVGMDALFGFDISKYPEYQELGREAAHHILYTVVNSAGMNGFVHGVEYVKGFAYYKLILIGWDVLAVAGLCWMGIVLARRIRNRKNILLVVDGGAEEVVEEQPNTPEEAE
ncbi:MAG: fibronectin type III-like domain-contianing protein [Clostridia bacterium]|nr:fibronectin type III-like domain-contianing protein [Clostridia bacterium]